LVGQIDRVAIRTHQPERLFSFFTEGLGLPVAYPLTAYPALTSGAVLLGNTQIEVVRYGPPTTRSAPSRGYVLSFESGGRPLNELEGDLERRAIPHSGVLAFYGSVGPARVPVKIWANLLLGGLFAETPLVRPFFSLSRVARRVPTAQEVASQATTVMKRLADNCFPNGIAYFTEYYHRHAGSGGAVPNVDGGYLGVRRMREVRVGARYIAAARERWGRVLNPIRPEAEGYWRIGDGPALRLILNGTDGIQTLVLQVRSPRQARAFLRERDLLRGEFDDELLVKVPGDRDLDIRLVA
jgi:hypothetical protein